MSIALKFWSDRRGSLRETTTMIAVATVIIGVGAAMGLDHLTRGGDLPRIAILPPASRLAEKLPDLPSRSDDQSSPPALDYLPVASIPSKMSQSIHLDPCTGAQK
jgi:hypothetical protein